MIRKLRVVIEETLLLEGFSSRTKLLRVGENLGANVASQIGCFVNNTSQNLAKCWIVFHGFAYNSLVSRPFSTRKVSNRSSHHVLRNGQRGGQFDSAFGLVNGLVNSPVKSWSNLVNLGQPWSNLVKAFQILGNVSRTTFRGFLGTVGPCRVGDGSVKPRSNFGQPRSNLVNPSQTWSNLGKCVPDLRRVMLARPGLSRFACRHPRKSCG